MSLRRMLLPIALLYWFAALLPAQEPQKPGAQTPTVQERAEALMERARHLSDIRAKNAPAFRLMSGRSRG
jgi:hypothetical protein